MEKPGPGSYYETQTLHWIVGIVKTIDYEELVWI